MTPGAGAAPGETASACMDKRPFLALRARGGAVLNRGLVQVLDGLGVDVPAETFVERVRETRPQVVGLSGFLTLAFDAMNRAAQPLLGEHDFLSFCKPREGASTTRTLLELSFTRSDDGVAGFARADAFCHSQVRTLMGTLIEVGRGARDEEWPYRRLVEQERNGEVIVAPPHPLTLEAVGYPEASQYADQAQAARRFRG